MSSIKTAISMSARVGNHAKDTNCLESILIRFFNGGKKQAMFLKNVKRNADGEVIECFTKKGGKVYEEFADFVYRLGDMFVDVGGWERFYAKYGKTFKLEGLNVFVKSLKNICESDEFTEMIDECDQICDGYGY